MAPAIELTRILGVEKLPFESESSTINWLDAFNAEIGEKVNSTLNGAVAL